MEIASMLKTSLVVFLVSCTLTACGQKAGENEEQNTHKEVESLKQKTMENKMKIEIWSDVMCPFCYIGKRTFETALAQFEHKDHVEVIWKSYQIDPALQTQPDKNLDQMMVSKGFRPEQAKAMNAKATQIAKQAGLTYNLDKAVPANTFHAHRFIHFSKQYGKQHEAEEILFASYFTNGKNIDDYPTLIALGKEIGLETEALKTALENGSFADAVHADINEAKQLGVSGVPFFIVNRKYAMSGAQDAKVFLQTIQKAYEEWRKENPETKLEIINGQSCTIDGKCD